MPGVVIPDDWDGLTYECLKVQWPSSDKWRAILLGQISEADRDRFWDPNEGNIEEAKAASASAYNQTIEQQEWVCNGGAPVEILPPIYFRATFIDTEQCTPNIWYAPRWDQFSEENGSHGFDLGIDYHKPFSVGLFGLWRYEYRVELKTVEDFYLDLRSTTGARIVRAHAIGQDSLAVNITTRVTDPEEHIQARIFCTNAVEIQNFADRSFLEGHYLGDLP